MTLVNMIALKKVKKKILLKEGVDLKRINYEYQEKKESSKVKQETKIINQEPGEDSEIDENEIINVNLYDQLNRDGCWRGTMISCCLVKHGQINACRGELFNPLQKIYHSRSDPTNPSPLIPALFIPFAYCNVY